MGWKSKTAVGEACLKVRILQIYEDRKNITFNYIIVCLYMNRFL